MREQAVVQKVGNRSGVVGSRRPGSSQKPARRERGQTVPIAERLRSFAGYVPTVLKLIVAIVIGVTLFVGYRAAAAASFFQVRRVEVQGTTRASAEDVATFVRKEVAKTGVWNADLQHLNAALVNMPWIRTAVVSRVLPDGIRVRISERVPRAVVRTSSGRFRWVDEDAVFLGEMVPTDQIPSFFLRGLSEEESEGARNDNADRVRKFLDLQSECQAAGIAERISEINVTDLRDVRVQLAGDDSQIEVRLGAQPTGKRLAEGLAVLDVHRNSARGRLISYVDLSQRTGAAIGFVTGPRIIAASEKGEGAGSDAAGPDLGSARQTSNAKTREKDSRQQPKEKDKDKNKRTAER